MPNVDITLSNSFNITMDRLAEQDCVHNIAKYLSRETVPTARPPLMVDSDMMTTFEESLLSLADSDAVQNIALSLLKSKSFSNAYAPLLVDDKATKQYFEQIQKLDDQTNIANFMKLMAQGNHIVPFESRLPQLIVNNERYKEFSDALIRQSDQDVILRVFKKVLETRCIGRHYPKIATNNVNISDFSKLLQKRAEQDAITNIGSNLLAKGSKIRIFPNLGINDALTKAFVNDLHKLLDQETIADIHHVLQKAHKANPQPQRQSISAKQHFRELLAKHKQGQISNMELQEKCNKYQELQALYIAHQAKLDSKAEAQANLEILRTLDFGTKNQSDNAQAQEAIENESMARQQDMDDETKVELQFPKL